MEKKKREYVLDTAEKMYMERRAEDSSFRSDNALDHILREENLTISSAEYNSLWKELNGRLKQKPRPDIVARAAMFTLKKMETDKRFTAEDGLVWVLEEMDSDYGLTKEQYDAYVWAIQQKIYAVIGTLEQLPLMTLLSAMNDFSACESEWNPITGEVAEKSFNTDITVAQQLGKDTSRMMPWDEVKKLLDAGKAVSCGMGIIRKRTDYPKCPRCGSSIIGLGALSRIDNKTTLCSSCGEAEAFEDFFHVIGG